MILTESFLPADHSVPLSDHTVNSLLAERAAQYPERVALIGASHDDHAEVRMTYADLHHEARCVATAIRGLAKPGEYVAVWAPNVVEWVLLQHGAALAGVVLVALNPVLREPELAYAVDHSHCVALIHADESRGYDMRSVVAAVASARPSLRVVSIADRSAWRASEPDDAELANAPRDPDLPVMLQYTSGTTGLPKGVLLRHRSLVNVARLTMEFTSVPDGAVTLNPLPMFHTAACVVGTLGPLWVGGTEILVEQFSAAPVLETMRREGVDLLFYVPTVLGALLEEQQRSERMAPRLRVVLGGASNVSRLMIEAAESTFGAVVLNLFGQTELAPVLTATRPSDGRRDLLSTIGHPLPQVDVKIADPVTGAVLPLGATGEICARGYQQFVEYLHDPAATAQATDPEGFVRTGDLGSMDERGYLRLAGRLKDLVIRGGENIAPAEIESVLAEHPDVLESAVFGLPDRHWGEVVAAAVRLRQGRGDVDSLIDHCRERLAPFKLPARWFVVGSDLPVTPTGKVQKFKLPGLVGTIALTEVFPTP